jgi:hypothetical protein
MRDPTRVVSLRLTISGRACFGTSTVYNVSGDLVSNCRCSVTTEMDAGAAALIAGGEWLHQDHASSSALRASSTGGERGSTPSTAQFLKRKQLSCPNIKEVHPAWTYARVCLPHYQPERNRHYQKLFLLQAMRLLSTDSGC